MTDKLKPCPFCGAEGVLITTTSGRLAIGCIECEAVGPWRKHSEGTPEAAWNHRVYQLEPPPAVLPVVEPPIPDPQEIREAVAAAKMLLARTPDLLDGEVYRRALDVAIAGASAKMCDLDRGNIEWIIERSDAIAAERERRKP